MLPPRRRSRSSVDAAGFRRGGACGKRSGTKELETYGAEHEEEERMSSFNQVIIVGNLGHDPELRHTNAGRAVLTLSVATSERFKDGAGEPKERTYWHQVVVWADLAESCAKYLKKGSRALVEGRLQNRKYEKDGEEHSSTEIVARRVQFLSARKERAAERDVSAGDDTDGDEAPPADEDIPF
jgi:single-strand DNA-binding protein